MTILPLSEVKARLSEIAEEVDRTHERVHITRNGRKYIVLMSADDLESIEATLELLADPIAQDRVAQAQQEIERGEGRSVSELEESLTERFGERPQ
ncbi:MAG TPA: type II toxin-antitoxin system Phd/YefM family antitoxin [Streptosporangiaceae bacterium]|nr:type II toxin-antitoxin system Phd/YefM family antitoxin [Streptosporangiaceae bacterium]